jgi:O-antigen ligase
MEFNNIKNKLTLIIILLICFNFYAGSQILSFLALGLCCFLISEPLNLFSIYYVTSIGSRIFYFDNKGTVSFSLVVFLVLLISTLLKLLKLKEIVNAPRQNYIFLLFSFIIVSVVTSLTGEVNGAIRILQSLVLLYFFSLIKTSDFRGLLRLIAWNSIVVILFFTVFYYKNILKILIISDRFSFNEFIHPNDVAMFYVQLGISSLIFMFYDFNLFEKVTGIVSYLIALSYVVISGSRTGLITILSVFITYLMYSNIVFLKKIKVLIVIGLLFLLGLFYIQSFDIPILERFSVQKVVDSGGSNRTYLIGIVIDKIIPENFLMGIGIGPENTATAMRINIGTTSVDNMYIETFAELGLIGFIMFYFYFIYLSYLFFKNRKSNIFLIFPLIIVTTCFINGIGELIFYEKFFWNGFILGVLMINNKKTVRFNNYTDMKV